MFTFKGKTDGFQEGFQEFDFQDVKKAISLLACPEHGFQLHYAPFRSESFQTFASSDINGIIAWMNEHTNATGVYYALNPVKPDLKRNLKNEDVLSRHNLLIDVDRKKTLENKYLAATDDEHEAARTLALSILEWLMARNWPAPVAIDSGNGWHLVFHIQLPNDEASRNVIRDFLLALHEKFSCEKGDVGKECHDARRISKLPGSWAKNKETEPGRPHRRCYILSAPPVMEIVTTEMLQEATEALKGKEEAEESKPEQKPASASNPFHGTTLGPAIERILDSECAKLSMASPGELNHCLFRSGAAMGNFVPHLLAENVVHSRLLASIRIAGANNPRKDDGTLTRGIHKGMETPRYLRTSPNGKPSANLTANGNLPSKPVIDISTEEHEVNDAAVAALAADPVIYQRSGMLVHCVRETGDEKRSLLLRPAGTPRISSVAAPLLRERLASAAQWRKHDAKKKEWVPAHPPEWSTQAVLARGQWLGIRSLTAVVDWPVLRPDGSVLTQPGYDQQTGLYLASAPEMPVTPDSPLADEVDDAIELLLEVVHDFPFAKPEHRSAWLASLLTPLARYSFSGPAPLFLLEANTPGSGKGLLGDITALILTGREMPIMSAPGLDEEIRKCVTSVAMAGDALVMLDNVDMLGGNILDAALTATVWRDRILGRNEMTAELPLRATWFATGNNVQLIGDVVRRICPITLRTPEEHPEDRTGFVHADLRQWVREQRGRLLWAALTVLRSYFAAQRPNQSLPQWGTFEGWSSVIREALVYVRQPDPALARHDMRQRQEGGVGLLRALILGLPVLDIERRGITAADILRKLSSGAFGQPVPELQTLSDALTETLAPKGSKGFPTSFQLGKFMGRHENRVVNGRCLVGVPYQGTIHWKAVEA